MIITAIIIGIIFLLVLFSVLNMSAKNGDDFDKGVCMGILMIMLLFIEITVIYLILTPSIPTALDVYQGKTTLEITYKDSVPIDSVVVFKEEFKKAMEE